MAENRRHQRLPMRLNVLCRKVGQSADKLYKGRTLNISTGGVLFETQGGDGVFERGDLLNLDLSVPPTNGLLEFGGRISGFARVVRTSNLSDCNRPGLSGLAKFGVAVEFCQLPRLSE